MPRISGPGFHIDWRHTPWPATDSALRFHQLRARPNWPDAALHGKSNFRRGSRRNLQFPEIRPTTAAPKIHFHPESIIFRIAFDLVVTAQRRPFYQSSKLQKLVIMSLSDKDRRRIPA